MTTKIRTWLVLLCVATFVSGPVTGQPVSVTDDSGQVVTLAAPALKIISLAPHLTELLFSLGVGERIIGTSRFSDFPPEAAAIKEIGDAFNLNVEAIVALQPDLVLAWATGGAYRTLDRLKKLGVPVYVNDPGSFEDIGKTLIDLGALTDKLMIAERHRDAFLADIHDIKARYEGAERVRVFLQISAEELYTVNNEHLMGQAIMLCNGINIFGDSNIPVPLVSFEGVVAARPDRIVISRAEAASSSWSTRWSGIDGLAGRLRFVDPGLLSRPALRMVQGVSQLCAALRE